MKNYVITIEDIPRSVQLAKRMIKSGTKHGIDTEMFRAVTPRNTNVTDMLQHEGLPVERFSEVYSRTENCIAAFLSHYHLWKLCVASNEITTIFEHDAVVINDIKDFPFDKVVSIGQPSYGKYNTPAFLGSGPLTSKRYFPGAHAYRVSPRGAKLLIEKAKTDAAPTDVFLHVDNFSWLQEHYPWLAKADDNFSTIQNEKGCLAKHNYGETYELL
tara:strand:- start:2049 stop:2693 length:645 start_codon:yes stop_codon:yes gene_type:complete